jgi:hypothetical protein
MYADLGHFNIRAIQVMATSILASLFFTPNSRSIFQGSNFVAQISEQKYLTLATLT